MKKERLVVLSGAFLIVCGLFLPNIIETHSELSESLLWRDDFNTQNSRWSWSYSTGTGFNNAPVTV